MTLNCFLNASYHSSALLWTIWSVWPVRSSSFVDPVLHLFQPSCSFHVYKQRVEIKKGKKKKSEVGKPATLQTPHVPGAGIEIEICWKIFDITTNMSIKCTIFLYASCSDCSLKNKIIKCNPCGVFFSGCKSCDLGFNLACRVHRTMCTDSNLSSRTDMKVKDKYMINSDWHHASVVLAQHITNLEILLKSASSFLVWRHELQRIDRGPQMWRSRNRTCSIDVVDYCICYHLPVWHVSSRLSTLITPQIWLHDIDFFLLLLFTFLIDNSLLVLVILFQQTKRDKIH